MTRRELAVETGLSTSQVGRLEQGIHRPRSKTRQRLAKVLDVPPDLLEPPDELSREADVVAEPELEPKEEEKEDMVVVIEPAQFVIKITKGVP